MRRRYDMLSVPGFRYLEDEELENPLLVVEEFFEATDLELFRQELRLFFALAFSNKAYKSGKLYEPARQATIHQRITRFLEMAWLILSNDRIDLSMKAGDPLFQVSGMWRRKGFIEVGRRMKDDKMKYCRVLEDEEINNVKLVFEQLFKYQSLAAWQDELDMVLFYSLGDIPMSDECENGQVSFPMHELLERLLETVHVMYELRIKGDEGWKVLPVDVAIQNKDYRFFPPHLIMSIVQQHGLTPV
ncbi:hypothetical protein H9X96_09045 [Pedobacter sp. N36a]|uniref:hypothetical protein n=1 Tax=Pedobacter sp. N36a TaxID=2767996 RepID=UPI0016574394|nr:hypothetical protein [Pedobacter sp. N36a]MBC8985923.1 hypothetical protein [Pedobacter sp. N36a]